MARRTDEVALDDYARLNNELVTLVRQVSKQRAALEVLSQERLEWLGMASHDLRSPLQGLVLMLEMLHEDLHADLAEEHARYLDSAQRAAHRILSLVNDLVDLAAVEHGHVAVRLRRVDPADVVREATFTQALRARAREVTIRTIAGEPPPVETDPLRLGQVLENLLSNAVIASPPGGEVRVRVEERETSLRISVEDDGPGLDAEDAETVFEPFVLRSEGDGRSGGLGLPIVRRLVAALGGTLHLETAPGEGAAFRVTLPLPPAADARSDPPGG